MIGKLPSFFKETIGAMLNLCLTVYMIALNTFVVFLLSCGCYCYVPISHGAVGRSVVVAFPVHTHLMFENGDIHRHNRFR